MSANTFSVATVGSAHDTEPMKVLQECLDLMRKKAHDYQNPNSTVKQAMYYENGLITLYDIINAKRLRLRSLIDAMQAGETPKNESIEDSFKDLANYCAIAAAWCRGKIDGQDPNKDLLNRTVPNVSFPPPGAAAAPAAPKGPIGPSTYRPWGTLSPAETTDRMFREKNQE